MIGLILDKIVFISGNVGKIQEVKSQLLKYDIQIIPKDVKIKELQEVSPVKLIKDKAYKCFRQVKHKFLVEHTELQISKLNGFPGVHTSPFWDTLGAGKITELYGGSDALARTFLAYCDGYKLRLYTGETKGSISYEPKGCEAFQWDCIFMPAGSNKTFAELGAEKEFYSMRKKAIEKFANEYLYL